MNKYSSNVKKIKHFLLGAGLTLIVTFAASSVFAQSLQGELMPCGSLGGRMTTPAECDAADSAAGIRTCSPGEAPTQGLTGGRPSCKATPPNPPCAVGQIPTNEQPCQPQFGSQQSGFQQQNFQQFSQTCAPGQSPSPFNPCVPPGGLDPINGQQNQQFNQQQSGLSQQQNQQPLFGQQQFNEQQTQQKIITPTIKTSGTTLASKGFKLAFKMQSSLNSKYAKAKGRTKKLAAVRSVAKKLPTLCRYISSGDDEADLDDNAFDCDAFVAELSEPIGDALKAKDYEVAYESTVAALESFGEVFESLQQ